MTPGSSCFFLIVIKFTNLFLCGMKLIPCQITLVYLFGMLEKEESVIEREIKHFIWNLGLKCSAYNRDAIHIALRNAVF